MGRGAELERIVVATDFSEGARRALERAVLLPLAGDASIDILHVLPENRGSAEITPLLDETRQSMRRALEAHGRAVHELYVLSEHGKPFVEIARCARNGKAELVLLGRSRSADKGLGATIERVLRTADVSVLVVFTAAESAYRRPLIAVDMSESSRLALDLAVQIRGAERALDVLHVIDAPRLFHPSEKGRVPTVSRLRTDREQRVTEKLLAFLGGIEAAAKCDVTLVTGDPQTVILEEARRRKADLLVLGAQGRLPAPHAGLGSVAEGVVRAARCDVLIARLPRAGLRVLFGRGEARRSSGPIVI